MGRKSIEELEAMAANGDKEAMDKLLHHRISNHADVRKFKVYLRRIVTILLVIIIIVVSAFIWFFASGTANKINEIRIDAARYALYRNPVEYQLLEHDVEEAIKYIEKTAYKYTRKYSQKINTKQIGEYVSLLCFYKIRYNNDTYLSMAITAAETEFDPTKISKKHAHGLNQIIPSTYREVNQRMNKDNYDIMDVYHNTDAALYYIYDTQKSLRRELKLERITIRQMAIAYNAGIKVAYDAMSINQYDNETLPKDTLRYMDIVEFYYTNYIRGNFKVWYYEKDYTDPKPAKTNS